MYPEAMSHDERLVFHARFKLPYHATKKNGKHAFRGFVVMSYRSRKAQTYLMQQLLAFKGSQKITEPIRHDLRAVFKFEFDDYYTKKGVRRLNLPDLSNLLELPADCLQKAGIIENDTLICSFDGSRRLHAMHNYLEILLYEFND